MGHTTKAVREGDHEGARRVRPLGNCRTLAIFVSLLRMSEKEAKVVHVRLARRASDHPHSFKQADAFRTCRICGLSSRHKIHRVPPDATPELGVKESPNAAPDHSRERPRPPRPQARPKSGELRRCPQCRKVNLTSDLSCYWCQEELPQIAAPALEEPGSC